MIVSGFYYGGRSYHYHDEVVLPAAHVDAWLESGYVRRSDTVQGMNSAAQASSILHG